MRMADTNQEEKRRDQYLRYKLGKENFATAIRDILLIVKSFSTLRVPGSPESMSGAISHGGMIIPVFNMGLKLGVPSDIDQNEDYSIVVLQMNNHHLTRRGRIFVGALVDSVVAIHEINPTDITSACSSWVPCNPQLIRGVIHMDGLSMMLPDMENLFTKEELSRMLSVCEKL